MKTPFLDLKGQHAIIETELMEAFRKVLRSNSFILGNELRQFECEFANWNQVKYCLGMSNGLDSLIVALKALNIGKGDEVIVPSNTFIATVLAITQVGAIPRFVEPRYETANINPEKIEPIITKKTKAIIPVHLYGQSCEMDSIMSIAQRNNLFVIEDNAQAQGAKFNGIKTGSWGKINATSFYPGKNLGCLGDGGAITTDDNELIDKVRYYRNYGSVVKYQHDMIGLNNRLDELQAAFLRIKLKHLDDWTFDRARIAQKYKESLVSSPKIECFELAPGATSVNHLFVIKSGERNKLGELLKQDGIETLIHYPIPPHLQKCYANLGYKRGDFPIAESLSTEVISLPLFVGMTDLQIERVVYALNRCVSKI